MKAERADFQVQWNSWTFDFGLQCRKQTMQKGGGRSIYAQGCDDSVEERKGGVQQHILPSMSMVSERQPRLASGCACKYSIAAAFALPARGSRY